MLIGPGSRVECIDGDDVGLIIKGQRYTVSRVFPHVPGGSCGCHPNWPGGGVWLEGVEHPQCHPWRTSAFCIYAFKPIDGEAEDLKLDIGEPVAA